MPGTASRASGYAASAPMQQRQRRRPERDLEAVDDRALPAAVGQQARRYGRSPGGRLRVSGRPVTLPSGWNAAMKIQSVGKTDQTMNSAVPTMKAAHGRAHAGCAAARDAACRAHRPRSAGQRRRGRGDRGAAQERRGPRAETRQVLIVLSDRSGSRCRGAAGTRELKTTMITSRSSASAAEYPRLSLLIAESKM